MNVSTNSPDKLKFADIAHNHKKEDTTDKTNYRPISILPPLSKTFESVLFAKISTYF